MILLLSLLLAVRIILGVLPLLVLAAFLILGFAFTAIVGRKGSILLLLFLQFLVLFLHFIKEIIQQVYITRFLFVGRFLQTLFDLLAASTLIIAVVVRRKHGRHGFHDKVRLLETRLGQYAQAKDLLRDAHVGLDELDFAQPLLSLPTNLVHVRKFVAIHTVADLVLDVNQILNRLEPVIDQRLFAGLFQYSITL